MSVNRTFRTLISAALASLAVLGAGATTALAVAPAPHLAIHAIGIPTVFSQEHNAECAIEETACDTYQLTISNSGDRTSEGPLSLTAELPANVEVHEVTSVLDGPLPPLAEGATCEQTSPVHCEYSAGLEPDQTLEITIVVTLAPGAVSGEPATVSLRENANPVASTVEHDIVGPSAHEQFGLADFSSILTGLDGLPETQAAGHPYELSTRIDLNSVARVTPEGGRISSTSIEDLKDVVIDLPVGLLGSALAAPKCTFAQLASVEACPSDTAVGQILTEPHQTLAHAHALLYNMVPEHGFPAEFGYDDNINNTHAIYTSVVPTPGGYALRAYAREIPQVMLTDLLTTFYGDPAATDGVGTPTAMFTDPADCSGKPLATRIYIDSWQNPGAFGPEGTPNLQSPGWARSETDSPPVTGCNALRFDPESLTVKPDTATADSPTGLSFDLKLPQSENPATLATPPLKDATVTLPVGISVNPAVAGGLQACTQAQIGYLGFDTETQVQQFSPAQPTCPEASKLGDVEVASPLLATTLHGSIYVATENENPFHSLLAGYIVIDDRTTGVLVKIPGELKTNASTGQITGVFNDNPQLPFSDLKLRFYGGERGALATPEGCGTFTTTSDLEPWSAPDSGPNAEPSDSFQIKTGCTPGFGPAFTAGTINNQAGGYSPLVLTFSRQDNEQGLSELTVDLPPGLSGKLAGISQCTDAQLAAAAANPSGAAEQASPECPANSRLGTVQSTAGVGSEPYTLPGTAYLTGPYKGAPYGIAVVVPALAGPFDLGNVVVRSKLEIDPTDAHVTVTSDPFPQVIDAKGADGTTDGFPIRLRSISVTMDRPSFTLNPTSCSALTVSGALTSTNGAVAQVASRFQAASCASLGFKPVFSASTVGRASKAGGASLDVKVAYPSGPLGAYANIKSVKVDLPKQLPSRLTTLQKACLASVFEANPANCPSESDVGMAMAGTPLLANPLVGPAYIVSHGGEAFPDLEIVLQGEGIKLILDGNTKIKGGITSSTFKAIPDAPVSSFELKLPTGKFSILGANVPQSAHYSLCGQALNMPTVITAQNGAVISQTTKIAVAGCAKKKALTRAQKLAAALKVCKRDKQKAKRQACEAKAHKQFGAVKKAKKKKK